LRALPGDLARRIEAAAPVQTPPTLPGGSPSPDLTRFKTRITAAELHLARLRGQVDRARRNGFAPGDSGYVSPDSPEYELARRELAAARSALRRAQKQIEGPATAVSQSPERPERSGRKPNSLAEAADSATAPAKPGSSNEEALAVPGDATSRENASSQSSGAMTTLAPLPGEAELRAMEKRLDELLQALEARTIGADRFSVASYYRALAEQARSMRSAVAASAWMPDRDLQKIGSLVGQLENVVASGPGNVLEPSGGAANPLIAGQPQPAATAPASQTANENAPAIRQTVSAPPIVPPLPARKPAAEKPAQTLGERKIAPDPSASGVAADPKGLTPLPQQAKLESLEKRLDQLLGTIEARASRIHHIREASYYKALKDQARSMRGVVGSSAWVSERDLKKIEDWVEQTSAMLAKMAAVPEGTGR
jgi:hypothetical protein